jgi:hypothetical protein
MLLRAKERKGSDVGCGEGGREYRRMTNGGRRDRLRPAGSEVALQADSHGYAPVRTATGTAPAALAAEVFWKSASWAKAISIACAMT